MRRPIKVCLVFVVALLMVVNILGCASSQPVTTSGAASASAAVTNASGEGPIKIGGMYDFTGDASVISKCKYYGASLAIAELNEAGGLLGRQIELIAPDCQSEPTRHQEMMKKLIFEDKVDLLCGTMFSACREAVRPIAEENKRLYIYDNHFEGGVASRYCWCLGTHPEQQHYALEKMMIEKYGPNYYFIGADYNYGWGTAKWTDYYGKQLGGKNVGTEFVPLSVGEFASSIEKIRQAKPDWVMICLTGVTQNSFFGQWQSAGMDIPICSTFLMAQSYEHKRFDPPALKGLYCITNYMEELEQDSPLAKDFNARMRAKFPDIEYVSMECENSYTAIMLWAEAVRKAGTVENEAVIDEMNKSITLKNMPSGDVTLVGETHTTTKNFYLVHADDKHNIIIDGKFEQVPADFMTKIMKLDLRNIQPPYVQYDVEGNVMGGKK